MASARPDGAPHLDQPLPIELINTVWVDRHGVHDALADLDAARRWATFISARPEVAALDGATELSKASLPGLRRLRDALRRIAADLVGDPRERARSPIDDLAAAIEVVNDAVHAAHARPALAVADGRLVTHTVPSGPRHGLLTSVLAAEAVHLFGRSGDLDLRACLAPSCVLYFIKDHPRREWCSPACGNRARAARHYARHGRHTQNRSTTTG